MSGTRGRTRTRALHGQRPRRGAEQRHDLAVQPGVIADQDWDLLSLQPYSSFEAVIFAPTGDVSPGFTFDFVDSALRARPDYALVHLNLAAVLERCGRDREAAMHYEQASRGSDARIRDDAAAGLQRLGRASPPTPPAR